MVKDTNATAENAAETQSKVDAKSKLKEATSVLETGLIATLRVVTQVAGKVEKMGQKYLDGKALASKKTESEVKKKKEVDQDSE